MAKKDFWDDKPKSEPKAEEPKVEPKAEEPKPKAPKTSEGLFGLDAFSMPKNSGMFVEGKELSWKEVQDFRRAWGRIAQCAGATRQMAIDHFKGTHPEF